MAKITYTNKVAINVNAGIPEINKVTDANMNEIKTVVNGLDDYRIADETSINNLNTGWLPTGETWTYASVDDPTGNITISGDKTTKYSLGMRIKFTNGGNVIYGIITKISYSSPNTTLTFLHEINPTNNLALNLMTNSAITANYYSNMKVPFGFPAGKNSWSVSFTTIEGSQNTPNTATYYNLGSAALTLPIGKWDFPYKITYRINNGATSTDKVMLGYISNSNNSLSSSDQIVRIGNVSNYYTDNGASGILSYEVTAKTTKYLIFIATNIAATGSTITLYSGGTLKAVSQYL